MSRDFREAFKHRRSCYSINKKSTISDAEIQGIVSFVLRNTPTAFNAQTVRMVLLLGEHHDKLWKGIVMETLKKIVPADKFAPTEKKINSFAAGYGTILYFQHTETVKGLQDKFPSYKDNFPIWAEQENGMHQIAAWVMLEDTGMGVSLQHYNPIIDEAVKKTWGIDQDWKLVAQMPFGGLEGEMPPVPEKMPLEKTMKVFE
ncbi:hypothetical protein Dip518_000373 [Parelusimicrobium proximum]|uniref:nitroreductase family protein n=1 Tax=Parelusimicrobium proximum TaxID=3228953 RepID=UPI003D170283